MVGSDIEEEDGDLLGLPPPATLRALDEQNTSELRIEVRRFTESRVRCVRNVGQPIPKNYATELIDDAITSTWLGITRWDPERCSLLAHVRTAILDRTSKEIRRGRRFPHVPIHAANDLPDAAQIEHALEAEGNSAPITFVGLVFRVASELKMVTCGDEDAQALLGCWHAGVIDRDDVIARTSLTPAAYIAARRRLLSLSKRLPTDLRESARELLRSAS